MQMFIVISIHEFPTDPRKIKNPFEYMPGAREKKTKNPEKIREIIIRRCNFRCFSTIFISKDPIT